MADETPNEPKQIVRRPRRAASRPAGPPVAAEAKVEKSATSKQSPAKPSASATPPSAGSTKAPGRNPRARAAAPEVATDAKKAPKKKVRGGLKAVEEVTESVTQTDAVTSGKSEKPGKAVPLAAVFQPADAAEKAAKRAANKAKAAGVETAETEELKPAKSNNRNRKRKNVSDKIENAESSENENSDDSNGDAVEGETPEAAEARRRRRRRGGRNRNRREDGAEGTETDSEEKADAEGKDEEDAEGVSTRRRRRRRGSENDGSADESQTTRGSTRLEAKKQRRRDGRDSGRRRAPLLSEAEFLARRENVNRVLAVREIEDRVQIAVLEDDVLVEHYVNKQSGSSLIGNVYLGRIQNVLPSMEAAFVDIGKGRNAVLYAGEVNWDASGLEGQAKRIETAFKTGDPVLVQVTKDPIGHKGARLTAQISMPGRFVVYVPDGSMTGISRKLPEKERNRLKQVLRAVLPEEAGVIVRTAAEGAAEEDLQKDVARLIAQWEDVAAKAKTANAPSLLYGEPDLAIRVVRDIFNEDFNELVIAGDNIFETIEQYLTFVAPDLAPRMRKWVEKKDLFAKYRIDEQLAKALDRKVWLPSGGSLVIDRTEAMTVVDVNTGKFVGEGGNLEQTVTRNNLEAAEEIVRQLRLRDIGGIIVVDFIDMVLESNRDLVLRRLIESLSRDRTKHQVAEVTSLGLVQMTRKRIGQGLLETFSESCDCCNGRGVKVSLNVSAAKAVELDPNSVEIDSV
jgi:ribonuclease E